MASDEGIMAVNQKDLRCLILEISGINSMLDLQVYHQFTQILQVRQSRRGAGYSTRPGHLNSGTMPDMPLRPKRYEVQRAGLVRFLCPI